MALRFSPVNRQIFGPGRQSTDVLIYPCVYGGPSGYRPITTEMAHALTTNYWHQGADGIYLFNYGPGQCELHDPAGMRGKDKFFAADRGRPRWNYPHNWIHCVLPASVGPGRPIEVPITIGEDLTEPPRPSAIVLKVVCSDATPENKLSLTLNDAPLSDPHPSDRWQTERLGPGDLWESATAFSTGLDPDQLEPGRNKVSLSVEMGEVVAHTVEVHVTY